MHVRGLINTAWLAAAMLTTMVLTAVILASCGDDKTEEQRRAAVDQRAEAYERAQAAVPAPRPENFPNREALAEYTERTDDIDRVWYVYVLADTGNVLGYYVAQTRPINSCSYLSSSEDVRDDSDGNLALTAPSLEGIFYGGGGSASTCDSWFFFDAATDAVVEIRGVKWFTADAPLELDAEPIEVSTE